MGRFTTKISTNDKVNTGSNIALNPTYTPSTYTPAPSQSNFQNISWPTVFPKPVIGLELDGVIVRDLETPLTSSSEIEFIPGSLEAIRSLRLKGHRLMILTDQPGIQRGEQTSQQFESIMQYLMQAFGQAGIMSIDGVLYSISNLKEDEYAKPNDGMFLKSANDLGVVWNNGWFVGHQLKDARAADRVGATPVILKTGRWEETMRVIKMHANRELYKKTQVFNNLQEFADSL